MFLTFSEAMPHKHNKYADGSSNSPMSEHYSCKAITRVWWMDGITERILCLGRLYCVFHKGMYCLAGKGSDRLIYVTEMAPHKPPAFFFTNYLYVLLS